MLSRISVALCLLVVLMSALAGAVEAESKPVSLIALIANPEKYQGKRIAVEGVARLEPEAHLLYLSPSDAEHLNQANAVWLELEDDLRVPTPYAQKAPQLNISGSVLKVHLI